MAYLHYAGVSTPFPLRLPLCSSPHTHVMLLTGMLTPVASVDNNGEAVPLAVDLSRPVTLIGRGPQLPAHGVHMYCKAGVEQKTVNAVSRCGGLGVGRLRAHSCLDPCSRAFPCCSPPARQEPRHHHPRVTNRVAPG